MEGQKRPGWPRLAFSRSLAPGPRVGGHDRFRRDVLPHLDAAYGYARYLTRNDALAEDIVHNAFVLALRAVDQCRGAVRPWLFAIIRNCWRDWARADARHNDALRAFGDDLQVETPVSSVECASDALALRRAIEDLPEPFREALVLRELEELSYREIAQVTQVPIGTVMSRLSRARLMLGAAVLGPRDSDKEATG